MENNKLESLSLEELLIILDKRNPSAKEWAEIKIKVQSIIKEMENHLETIRYFEKLMKKKKYLTN